MQKLFQTEIMICASLYILADSLEEAQAKADTLTADGAAIEFSNRRQEIGDGLFITGETFSPDMPELSLSPAMTIQPAGKVQHSGHGVYLSEDFDEPEDVPA
jgi:hypothetical protein